MHSFVGTLAGSKTRLLIRERAVPVGDVDDGELSVHNHMHFNVKYMETERADVLRVVSVEVTPERYGARNVDVLQACLQSWAKQGALLLLDSVSDALRASVIFFPSSDPYACTMWIRLVHFGFSWLMRLQREE